MKTIEKNMKKVLSSTGFILPPSQFKISDQEYKYLSPPVLPTEFCEKYLDF